MRAHLLLLACLLACSKDKDVTALPPWPDWVLSHWIWEDEGTRNSATQLVDDYRSMGIPVGALVIDSPWETGYNTFVVDEALYPAPQAMIDALHARDVRVLFWITSAMRTYFNEHGAVAFHLGQSLMTFSGDTIDHYMLGPDILVAPMLDASQTRRVAAPAAGNWPYLFDPTVVLAPGEGRDLTVPLEHFPVLVREGAAVWNDLRAVLDPT